MPTVSFAITLDRPYTEPASVYWAASNGTGLAGESFTPAAGTATFLPGETSKTITINVTQLPEEKNFHVMLSQPQRLTIGDGDGLGVIPGTGGTIPDPEPQTGKYFVAANALYTKIKAPSGGYYGPATGPKAFTIPYHARQRLLVEAPDAGHQSVSETISFDAKLEAWNLALNGSATGLTNVWSSVESNYIPNATNQPWGTYNLAHPADYQPEQDTPNLYPVIPTPTSFPAGAGGGGSDPLATELQGTYGSLQMYLMHWFLDTDGDYGYKNRDSVAQTIAFINSYQRGMQESTWETITHPEFDDWTNGGSSYGFTPIFAQSSPMFPSAPFPTAKQVRYTVAPDAEARLIGSQFLAEKFAAEKGVSVSGLTTKAKKMGDYLRYCLYDKYFRKGAGVDGSGFTGLISWYMSFGMEHNPSAAASWGFRISSSNYHQGYQAPNVAYQMATGGGGFTPLSSTAGAQWLDALNHQLELLRWLQTPEGAIAGGVTNSWRGRYETPTDGRQLARFNGLYFDYAPEWKDPPSNKWFGFQCWSMDRVAELLLIVATKTDALSVSVRHKCVTLLDRWVNWVLNESELIGDDDFALPADLDWTSATPISGKTTTSPNNEGRYEYLPSLDFNSATTSQSNFWNSDSVPNPNLKCIITASGRDLGTAANCAQVLIQYAHAKRTIAGGALTDAIPGGSHTVRDALDLAQGVMDRILDNYGDAYGFTQDETRTDYNRFNSPLYIPSAFSGTMKNGDPINSSSTFISTRTFMKTWEGWDDVQTYLDGGPAPTFKYHRFWHAAEIAVAFAQLHHLFADVLYT